MASTLPEPLDLCQRERSDRVAKVDLRKADHMAKADLRSADTGRHLIGRALERSYRLRGWSLKEFAAALDRDERQIARWIEGSDRPQFDRLFMLDEDYRRCLIVAFAEIAGEGVIVTTHIHVASRRTA